MSNENEAPALPGEAWRGVVGSRTFAITRNEPPERAVFVWTREGRWVVAAGANNQRIAWREHAMAERAAREKAEALAKAERAYRKALDRLSTLIIARAGRGKGTSAEIGAAEMDVERARRGLIAAGGTP